MSPAGDTHGFGAPEVSLDEDKKRTLLAPARAAETWPTASGVSHAARGLPPDLLREASRRLQVLALLLAATFFLAAFLGHLLDILVGDIEFFQDLGNWTPGTVTILVSLLVYGAARSEALPPAKLMDMGLVFGALSSFGIAASEFWGAYSEAAYRVGDFFGLSWVAVWMLCYTIIIPNRPSKTLLSLLVSALSVPIVIGLSMRYAGTMIPVGPGPFFFGAVFPYLVCVGMAYVGARVVYKLGTAVSRARELGSYRLIDILGRGGMGEVWRAQHRMLARPAAIKLIRPEALGESNAEDRRTILARFEREAQATASLRSPHTIALYDFGISDAGTFYYVMELLEGLDADSLVRRFGPVPPEDEEILRAFLGSDEFVLTGPPYWNALALGTTAAFPVVLVYNTRRTGEFTFGHRRYRLRRVRFPTRPSAEWYVIDLLEHRGMAGVSRRQLATALATALRQGRFDPQSLRRMAREYGTRKTQDLVESAIGGSP